MKYKLQMIHNEQHIGQANPENNPWWKNSVIYQIYPRSFQDSNADGIGDLQGIIDRLGYLVALGIDAIWLSPIFSSPMADFGYDVSDYCNIDPMFGSLETFDNLLQSCHANDIKVILDFVANHTSDQHPWFEESRSTRKNAKRDWYIWRDAKENGDPPNNWLSFFGNSAWTWDEATQQYYLHLFFREQPDLNWRNPEVVQALHDVLRFWLDRGVDGFRMDAVTMLIKHADMPDMPQVDHLLGIDLLQNHIYVHNQPELHDVLRGFRQLFDAYPGQRVIIGETGDLDPQKLVSYYGENLDEIHLPFNFIPMHTPWVAAEMKKAISNYLKALPPGATPNFVFGNHDVGRLATRFGHQNHRSVAMLTLTLPGVATIYYGDELGMENCVVPAERIQDPVQIRSGDLQVPGRDPARGPMPWMPEPNGGFTPSDCTPWLPLIDDFETMNVFLQEDNSRSTLNFYRKLIDLRSHLPALKHGSFSWVAGGPADLMAYIRQHGSQRLLIIINFTGEEYSLDLSQLAQGISLRLSSQFTSADAIDIAHCIVKGHESLLLQLG